MTPAPTEYTPNCPATDLWQRCERVAATLTIPDPFDITAFVHVVAAQRGRPIEMIPVTTVPGTPCGLLAVTRRADYVVYAANTTALHREHIQLHEIAHLVCGHVGTADLDPQVAALLMPTLPIEVVHRIVGRTTYNDRQEQEAELLASLIRYRASPTPMLAAARRPAGSDTGSEISGEISGEISAVLDWWGGLFEPRRRS